ncbi:hypothetical protein HDU93_008038 [Gonapodya sp. JEL0774]|nr:hypothetical protein HDU93_008038 [Gonapodya sp. JEL0774]
MIEFLNRKFSCSRCIAGHRSSSCEHTSSQLVEIKSKGRPSTQCGHCKTRRSHAVGAHAKCVCGIVAEQVEGKKRVELRLSNGASLSFVAAGASELALLEPLAPGTPVALRLVKKGKTASKRTPEPSDDGMADDTVDAQQYMQVDIPLAGIDVKEEEMEVNWEQVLRTLHLDGSLVDF